MTAPSGEQHEIRHARDEFGGRFTTRGGQNNLVLFEGQNLSEHLPNRGIIISQQDRFHNQFPFSANRAIAETRSSISKLWRMRWMPPVSVISITKDWEACAARAASHRMTPGATHRSEDTLIICRHASSARTCKR